MLDLGSTGGIRHATWRSGPLRLPRAIEYFTPENSALAYAAAYFLYRLVACGAVAASSSASQAMAWSRVW